MPLAETEQALEPVEVPRLYVALDPRAWASNIRPVGEGTDHYIVGSLRAHVSGDEVQLAGAFDDTIRLAAQCGDRWIFQSTDGRVGVSSTFTGPFAILDVPADPIRNASGHLYAVGGPTLLELRCEIGSPPTFVDAGLHQVSNVRSFDGTVVAVHPLDAYMRLADGSWRSLGLRQRRVRELREPRFGTHSLFMVDPDPTTDEIRAQNVWVNGMGELESRRAAERPDTEVDYQVFTRAAPAWVQPGPGFTSLILASGGLATNRYAGSPMVSDASGAIHEVGLPDESCRMQSFEGELYAVCGLDAYRIRTSHGDVRVERWGSIPRVEEFRIVGGPYVYLTSAGEPFCELGCLWNVETREPLRIDWSSIDWELGAQYRDDVLVWSAREQWFQWRQGEQPNALEPSARAVVLASEGRIFALGVDAELLVLQGAEVEARELPIHGVQTLRWLGGDRLFIAGATSDELWQSADAGRHWERVLGPPLSEPLELAAFGGGVCIGGECNVGRLRLSSSRMPDVGPIIVGSVASETYSPMRRLACDHHEELGPWPEVGANEIYLDSSGRDTRVVWQGIDRAGAFRASAVAPPLNGRTCSHLARTRTHSVVFCTPRGEMPDLTRDVGLYLLRPRGAPITLDIKAARPTWPEVLLRNDGSGVLVVFDGEERPTAVTFDARGRLSRPWAIAQRRSGFVALGWANGQGVLATGRPGTTMRLFSLAADDGAAPTVIDVPPVRGACRHEPNSADIDFLIDLRAHDSLKQWTASEAFTHARVHVGEGRACVRSLHHYPNDAGVAALDNGRFQGLSKDEEIGARVDCSVTL